jgi:DNA ligase-1
MQFAQVNDSAAATTKKLQKQAILAEYFRTLTDEDLRLAVRFVVGWPSGLRGVRVLNVGWALVSAVSVELLGLDPRTYHDLVVKSGEIGEALSRVWKAAPTANERPAPPPQDVDVLTLHEIARCFDDLADTGNQERKREILRELYSRCIHPREAAYLSKIIFREMRTGIQEGVLLLALAQAFERTFEKVQRCQLLVGDLGEVAVMAKNDALSCATFRLFHPIQFMLATAQEDSAEAAETMAGRTFYAEDKFDGIRAQVHKQGDQVVIYTRTMEQCEASYPDVVAAVTTLPGDFLIDGEIVPYENGSVLPFAHIQRRLGRKVLTPKIIRENPLKLIAFDLLYQDGQLLMDEPLRQRRQRLEALINADPACGVLLSRAVEVSRQDEIDASFCNARDCRNEGLMLKDPDSPYSPGRRGQSWLKLKTHLPTLDCVVTAAETGHGKRRNSLSDYTFAVWDREPTVEGAQLVNVGKAYSGVTDAEIAQLTELFTQLTVQQYGRVRLVEPKIVLEIACDQIQKSNRHNSGYAFRFPRIKRIRWDKRPEDADRLSRVIEIYQSTTNFGRGQEKPAKVEEPTLFDL